jgi:MarR family transcriptional regulator for hemolysin
VQSSNDEPLARVLVMTGKAIREDFEEALTRAGASLATWVVLNGIDRGRWESQRELAKDLRIEGATLTRHLDRMERDGLIVRTRDLADRRQIQVELTKDGRELHRSLRTTAQKIGARAFGVLSEREQATLRRLLDRVRVNVGGRRDGER